MIKYNLLKGLFCSLLIVSSSLVYSQGSLTCNPTATPDVICSGEPVQLDANASGGSGNYSYTWTSDPPGFSSDLASPVVNPQQTTAYLITVDDGYELAQGSVTVTVYLPSQIDETNVIITPTTCNGASGSITGLQALGSPPLTYQWLDLSGNPYGTNIDATNLPAGQYILTITDANGCETASGVYTIIDAGNLQILNVELNQPHCSRPDGQIVVHAFSPGGSALQYSIDDGMTYQADSVFSGLGASTYMVRVTDGIGCFGFYTGNPVVLTDIPGPLVTQVIVTDETDFLANGTIEMTATGSTATLYYSNDNGNTYQANNGTFNNLAAGTYICLVKDENDCDTTFTIEIQNIILSYLQVSTVGGAYCLDNAAVVPVQVENFHSVASFKLKLGYNEENLQCEGFTNVHPQLIDSLTGWVDQAEGVVNLFWNSPSPVTFAQSETILELIFTTKNPGQGELYWHTVPTESYFTSAFGNPIPTVFQTGGVFIYEIPEFNQQPQNETLYFGNDALFSVGVYGDLPQAYQWYGPSGLLENDTLSQLIITGVSVADAGNYYCTVTNVCGSTTSSSATLTAYDQLTIDAGTDVTLMLGDSTVLNGSYTGGSPSLTIHWTPDTLLYDPDILNPQTVALFTSQAFTLTVDDLLVGFQTSNEVMVTVIVDDTLAYFGSDDDTLYNYMTRGYCGYISGNNCDQDKIKANCFTDETISYDVEKVLLRFGKAVKTTVDEVPVKIGIWAKSMISDTPGDLIDYQELNLSQIVQDVSAGNLTSVTFDSPVAAPKDFFVGVFLPTGVGDTLALMTNKDGESEAGIAWTLNAANEWLSYSSDPRFFLRVTNAIFPVVRQNNVGIDDFPLGDGNILIYPNPANNVLNIQFKEIDVDAQFEIFDIQGKTMISKQIQQEKTNINIGNLNPGVYIIRLEYNQNLVTRKLIVH